MRIIKNARGREIIVSDGPEKRPWKGEIISTNNIEEIQAKRRAEADALRAKEEAQHGK